MSFRTLRVGDGALPELYSRCKILDNISNHLFNFMGIVTYFLN
jgi:hypothetical protein